MKKSKLKVLSILSIKGMNEERKTEGSTNNSQKNTENFAHVCFEQYPIV